MANTKTKKGKFMRFSDQALKDLESIKKKTGLTETAIIERSLKLSKEYRRSPLINEEHQF